MAAQTKTIRLHYADGRRELFHWVVAVNGTEVALCLRCRVAGETFVVTRVGVVGMNSL